MAEEADDPTGWNDFDRVIAGREVVWAAIGGAAVFAYSAAGRFVVQGDTLQYAHHSILRPPLYPLFLDILARLGWSWQAAVVLQSFFVAAAAFFLSLVLRRRLNLAPWAYLATYFLTVVPLLPSKSVYFSLWGLIGRAVMTEALAYGLFLLTYAFLVESVCEPSVKNFSLFSAFAVLNTAVRAQFVFVYAAVPAFLLWFYLRTRDGRRLARLAAAFVACLLAARVVGALGADREAGSGAGDSLKIGLLPNALFFSAPEDMAPFAGRPFYPLLDEISRDLDAKKYRAAFHEEMNEDLVPFYISRYVPIFQDAYGLIQRDARAPSVWDDRTVVAAAPLADAVVPAVMRRHWREYARLAAHLFVAGFSFRYGLAAGWLAACWFWGLRRPPDVLSVLTAVMAAANHAVVALLQYNSDRHLFYTDTFALIFVVILLGMRTSGARS